MPRQETEDWPPLKVGTGWIDLIAVAEPIAKYTSRGYAVVLPVRVLSTNLEYILYLSARTLAEPIERLREENDGRFTGLRFRVRKESTDKLAKYIVEGVGSRTATSNKPR